jgi:endonuclease/exonuclease/phosphatase family metal-dependent hydrolase
VSDHRFEQRGLLHVPIFWRGIELHAIVVHLGLIHASRLRQAERLGAYLREAVPADAPIIVAGDFNDWGERLDPMMHSSGLLRAGVAPNGRSPLTFPSRLPLFSLDRVYTRGLRCTGAVAPRGPLWARLSDHLPLIMELEPM